MIELFRKKVAYVADQKLLYYRIHGGNTLSEAAIVGREQDRELIEKYMLAAVPEECQRYVSAGSRRLVVLNTLKSLRKTR